jgi:CheY-like chemotaxis protein
LLIEDDAEVSDVIVALLQDQYDVRCALSVADAWDSLRRHTPDLVLCDGALPTTDGYDFTAQLRSTPQMAGLPVVITSGVGEAGCAERAREAGAVAFLPKPFLADELRSLLASVQLAA